MSDALIAAIRAGDLDLALPQTLTLADGSALVCHRLLRLLPGKRAVFVAERGGRSVLAKLFLTAATRQMRKEVTGYELLHEAGLPTPELQGREAFAGGIALLYRYLEDAAPAVREDQTPAPDALDALLEQLLAMYWAGLYQRDLHCDNFLRTGDSVWIIDPGQIEEAEAKPLAAADVIRNLALLVVQFRRCDQARVLDQVAAHPISAMAGPNAARNIGRAAEGIWRKRKLNLLNKCFRSSTATFFVQYWRRVAACERARLGDDFTAFVRDPDAWMARGEPLKLGNSATVVKVVMDGRPIVIKRYNMKNALHWLRRCWRPSRAWVSWRNAHWLHLLGLHTPPPLGFVEVRWGPLRRRAYYLCDYVEGIELDALYAQREPLEAELAQLAQYFEVAARDHVVHGDMKATNLFVAEGVLNILDLDAMREVRSRRRWARLFGRDLARFARNWPADSSIGRTLAPLLDVARGRLDGGGG